MEWVEHIIWSINTYSFTKQLPYVFINYDQIKEPSILFFMRNGYIVDDSWPHRSCNNLVENVILIEETTKVKLENLAENSGEANVDSLVHGHEV